ncbi:NAD(P)(+)--arginine ADP-ribosyltransferase 2-like [Labeo rohita]|uniref:NAD(P)(+)--arginine ADP-ribosyltransferase 2-like n=1 Tax=Labeo rohita TaxID=84645 RepID=UPI0021E2F012|nr:NAD(P)(+)--arginine ADP-ribosyltransferase 2-like [Labeo rohita]
MLLIIQALLLISAALGQDHRAAVEGQTFPLDMAPNSVDDQYEGCRGKMADQVEKKYMKQEMSNPETKFANAWKLAEKNYKPPGDKLTKDHSISIYVYTNSDTGLYKDFNDADRKDKERYKNETYKWYSLHFLLTDAIQMLKKTQKKCYTTYRGTNIEFEQNVLRKNICFGSFTSLSINSRVTEGFGSKSCFEIYTCEGADVIKYSKYPEQKEVLIPPYETFKVTAVKTKRNQKDLWCHTVFSLKSSGKRSNLNCDLFKKPTNTMLSIE